MRRLKETRNGVLVDEKGSLLYLPEVTRFLSELEKDQNIHVILSKIRLMKEHLK